MRPSRASSLPRDVWTAAGLPDTGDALNSVEALARMLMQWHGAPRDPSLLKRYCRDLPGGRVLLYGAGTLTRVLLADLPAGIQILGIVDRMGAAVGEFCGHRVWAPEDVAMLDFDYVVLAHNVYEMEMRRALVAAGVAMDRVITVHADPRYHALAAPMVSTLVDEASRRPVDAVVISCTGVAMLEDRQLAQWLPPERTVHLFIGREWEDRNAGTPYETIHLSESLTALKQALLRLKPRIIYARSVIYRNYLGVLAKHWLPDTTVIQEFYDFNVLWPDADLMRLFGLDAVSIEWLRRAELIAGQTLDLVISKRGGAAWGAVWGRCRAPYRIIFPQVQAPEPDSTGHEAALPSLDLVYAGFLPAPAFLRTFPIGYNFLPLLEQLGHEAGLTVDIFNSSHNPGPSGDTIFAEYLDRYASPPVTYHSRLGYSNLLARLPHYRYGWLCNDQQTLHGDREVGVCNRWTGYVSAGIPTLLDKSWGFMGDLIREYGAGIVIDRPEAGPIIELLRAADRPALADGVRRLRAHLLKANQMNLADIATVIERGLKHGAPL